ncbi:MAG: YaaC family protein [Candidatus Rokubacteria bacterium]|nr:YaaC family protein [Candidatus Rokubacteria bacterium]
MSEIPDEGKRLVQFHSNLTNDAEITALYKLVRSFIRQAETYYRAARTLHYRSSALLYYYCFLNLAKAVLSVRGLPYDARHGLTSKIDAANIDTAAQAVEVHAAGVFPAFYQQQVQATLPHGVRLDIKNLLGYVAQVAYQYETAKLGRSAVYHSCYARLLGHFPNDQGWWTIAVPRDYDFTALPTPNRQRFDDEFEEVELSKESARECFGIFATSLPAYRFYQSKTVTTWSTGIPRELPLVSLFGCMEGYIEPKYVEDGCDFTLSRPFIHPFGPFRMTELPAIYLVMFYLGSLVRYRPDYLDDLLETRAAWMLEGFVTSAPLTALRAFVSKITDKVYVFNK